MTKQPVQAVSHLIYLPVVNGKPQGEEYLGKGAVWRVTSEELQGEGSWVEFSHGAYGETKAINEKFAEYDDSPEWLEKAEAHNREFLARHIVAWNWVDNDGKPLPLPKDDPGVFDGLYLPEWEFLIRQFRFVNDSKS